MSPTHPHGPDRDHHAHAHHAHHRKHHHVTHQRRRPHARPGFRGVVDRTVQVLFQTRYGNWSRFKIASLGIVGVACIYVLLVRGFFPFDVASPWIESALERQLGPGHKVSIGSTRLDHDETGAPVLRVERIRVFGPGGKVIANAPSAEVGLDGSSLLLGSFRARRIDLVGAETTIHVGADGRVAISAGRDAAPITSSDNVEAAAGQDGSPQAQVKGQSRPVAPSDRPEPFHYPELVRWLDSFERGGIEEGSLTAFHIALEQFHSAVADRKTLLMSMPPDSPKSNVQLIASAS